MATYKAKVQAELDTSKIEPQLQQYAGKLKSIKINMDTGEVLSQITEISNRMGNVKTVTQTLNGTVMTTVNNTQKWAEQQENLRSRLSTSTTQLERMSETVTNMSSRWGSNTRGIQEVQSRIANLQSQYSGLVNSSDALDASRVRQLNNEQREIQESINLIRTQNQGLNKMGGGMAKFVAQFMSIQKAIQMTISMMRNMVDEVFKLDASLTELAKVSNMAKDEMGSLTEKAFEMGDEIGRTGREVINATTEFKRAGYTMQESFDLGETALVMTNIADGIDNVSEASTNLISIMKGFNISATDSEHIIDAFNNVSNNMATTYANLVDVMQRSSATLSQAGVSLEQGIGLATGALEILGDKPEQVGRALNSLTMRLRGLTEVGEDG